ncbi:unnamed protein product [Gordionus sp. m RMFG-2023]|uniref:nudC domain-containing protein 3-like isoform X2 n=1 Tax=Gordionus sp. m RMFG-2023 TaxID=3053472 RepID=UPI0030DF8956
MEESHNYDNLLMMLLSNEGTLDKFFDKIFNFLHRKTDFYKILKSSDGKFGFPKGYAEELVKAAFTRYQILQNETVITKNYLHIADQTQHNNDIFPRELKSNKYELLKLKNLPLSGDSKKDQIVFQKYSESYNGAIRENYVWTQTNDDIDVRVFIEPTIMSQKDISIKIDNNYIEIKTLIKTLISGFFHALIKKAESFWSIIPGDHIHVNLEKMVPRMWPNLLQNEKSISLGDLELSQNMEDLPEDEQNTVQRLVYDEQQKVMGKPTSQQMVMADKLKEAWNKPGSPFLGQPFDISKVNISGSYTNE